MDYGVQCAMVYICAMIIKCNPRHADTAECIARRGAVEVWCGLVWYGVVRRRVVEHISTEGSAQTMWRHLCINWDILWQIVQIARGRL